MILQYHDLFLQFRGVVFMVTSLHARPLDSLCIARETTHATNMNLIFDLCGVLFGGNGITSGKNTYVIRPVDPVKTVRLLQDCIMQGHRLFALSSWSRSMYNLILHDPWAARILDYFDDIVLAAEVGLQKSDQRIFNHLLFKHHLDPRRCIVIDNHSDTLKNAAYVGIAKGILCIDSNIKGIREDLQLYGAL